METETPLIIEWQPAGRTNGGGMVTVTAKIGGEPLAVERLDVLKPKAREGFVTELCRVRGGIDKRSVANELMRIAGIVATPQADAASPDTFREIDASRIVRPERFITPELSGLAVPTLTEHNGKPAGRYALYLAWADGKRERLDLPASIELSAGGRLWVHPQPGEPTPGAAQQLCGWSADSRRRWIETGEVPHPAELFYDLCERIDYFIDLPAEHGSGTTATLALWALLTYCYPAWDAVPYLYVGGPLGSGKSRVFEILSRLALRPLASSNMTAPAMFRTLHDRGGVLLLDEAERLKHTQSPEVGEILSMLLAGYKRGGQATRLEAVGDSFKTVAFDVYGPKALACIAGLPPALASRCIPLSMFRAGPESEKPRRRIDADPAGWQRLRDELHVMALSHGPTWLDLAMRADVCPAMSGRNYELWQPIMALAAWLEEYGVGGLLDVVQTHALTSIDAGRDEQTPDADEILLRILASAAASWEWPTAADILAQAQQTDPAVFKNWLPRTVSGRLKTYGIPAPRKSGSRREYRDVTPDLLLRIQRHYGIDLDIHDAGADPLTCPVPASPASLPSHEDAAADATSGTVGTVGTVGGETPTADGGIPVV